jgi:hypothetical protein
MSQENTDGKYNNQLDRDLVIVAEIRKGMSVPNAAVFFSLSRQRVHQILRKCGTNIKKIRRTNPAAHLSMIEITCLYCGRTFEARDIAKNRGRRFCGRRHYELYEKQRYAPAKEAKKND